MKTANYFGLQHRVVYWQKNRPHKKGAIKKILARWRKSITSRLRKFRKQLSTLSANSEPKVWQKKDGRGNFYYRVYDPIGDRYFCLNSEAEVRWWLDKRYYL